MLGRCAKRRKRALPLTFRRATGGEATGEETTTTMSTGDDEPISQDKKDENLIMATTAKVSIDLFILDTCVLVGDDDNMIDLVLSYPGVVLEGIQPTNHCRFHSLRWTIYTYNLPPEGIVMCFDKHPQLKVTNCRLLSIS